MMITVSVSDTGTDYGKKAACMTLRAGEDNEQLA